MKRNSFSFSSRKTKGERRRANEIKEIRFIQEPFFSIMKDEGRRTKDGRKRKKVNSCDFSFNDEGRRTTDERKEIHLFIRSFFSRTKDEGRRTKDDG